MLAKFITGVVGLLVVAAGGYFYWENLNNPASSCRRCQGSNECPVTATPCCAVELPCPTSGELPAVPEQLDIMPRELTTE